MVGGRDGRRREEVGVINKSAVSFEVDRAQR